MGYSCHTPVFVMGFQDEAVAEAHAAAVEIFGQAAPVSPVLESPWNAWRSFYVAPDGSKEGGTGSTEGDRAREAFVAWLRAARRRGLWLQWLEIEMPEDGRAAIRACDDDDYEAELADGVL